MGFSIAYQRPEEGFAYLTLGEAALLIDAINQGRTWKAGALEHPLGRGINFQITVDRIDPLLTSLNQNKITLFMEPEEKWYRRNTNEVGNRQCLSPGA